MTTASEIDGLPRCEPEEKGVNSQDVLAFLKDAEASGITLNGFMLYRKGAVISEGWWYPYHPKLKHMMHSATKSFLSVAVGMAIQEGYFSLDDKVVSFFPEHLPEKVDPNLAAMTVEDLLTQTSGHASGASGGTWRSINTSWIEQFFKISVVHQPGTFFKYSSATSFMLSAIVHHTTGQSTWEFLMPRLFQPLGIRDLTWDIGPEGINPGGNGISCRLSDLLKLAILHLQGGVWQGQRLLAEDWVSKATTSRRGNEYGYQWWIGQGNSYYAYGLFGQFAFVFPEHEAILVTNASDPPGETNLRALVWRHFPGLFKSMEKLGPAMNHDLKLYLQDPRILKPLQLFDVGMIPNISDRLFVPEPNADNIEGFSFEFSDDTCIFHLWDSSGLHRVDIGLKTWMEGDTTLPGAMLHHGYQPMTLLVAAGGIWTSPTTFEITLQFIETSFQDTIILRLLDGNKATLDRSVNVNSFATIRPTICAHMLGESTGVSRGLRIKERAAKFHASNKDHVFSTSVHYSTSTTSIDELLNTPETKAVLMKEVPNILSSPQINAAKPYTLVTVSQHVPLLTEDVLRKIDEGLSKLST